MSTLTAPTCSCSALMVETTTAGFFVCAHCDSDCHKRCDPKVCDQSSGKGCVFCNAFDIGSRPKRDRSWTPPKR